MDTINFALPQISSADMSKDEQGALIVNQATAAIVSAWLEHANVVINRYDWASSAGEKGSTVYWDCPFVVKPEELVSLINNVQDSLKSF
jgi:hypothetical protein